MSEKLCVVVVTYNRKELLKCCLNALLQQAYRPNKILVVNNASTDGTTEILELEFPQIEVLKLAKNLGGAGGFHEGIKRAYSDGFDWLWLMDDDSIPEPDALAELFSAYYRFDPADRPRLLASKVVWLDDSLHSINIPQVKTSDPEKALLAAQHSTLSIRYATFVSLLLHRSLIEQYGLPIADYFIWSDDIEYTARILRNEFGVAVPRSIVLHKTASKHTHLNDAGFRYYYHIRNNIWMLIHSDAWSRNERIKKTLHILREIIIYLATSGLRWQNIHYLVLGLKDGFLTIPKS
jgi:GT2 family glycosyltransferase